MYNLFLDDERFPHDVTWVDLNHRQWIIARTYSEFCGTIKRRGLPELISFDHDLGPMAFTGYDCAKWLVEYILDNNLDIDELYWLVHSQNPIGAKNINSLLTCLVNFRRETK